MCNACMSDTLGEMEELHLFKREYPPLRAFDPFAGVGALVKGLVNVGAVKLTHAIEICPSTARTLRFAPLAYQVLHRLIAISSQEEQP